MSMSIFDLLGYEFNTSMPYSELSTTNIYFALIAGGSTPPPVSSFRPILMFF